MDDENESRGFKVEDRRRFSATGDLREDAAQSEASQPAQGDAAQTSESPRGGEERYQGPLPEMTFSTFVIGLSTQALIVLGEMDDRAAPTTEPDLPAAKQLIDILGILQAKTRNNLDDAETGLLEAVLYDLRMKYVQRSRSK